METYCVINFSGLGAVRRRQNNKTRIAASAFAVLLTMHTVVVAQSIARSEVLLTALLTAFNPDEQSRAELFEKFGRPTRTYF